LLSSTSAAGGGPTAYRPLQSKELGLLDIVDRILDKGVVITGDITLSFAGVDILSLKINLVIASLETAKRYGIDLPWEKWAKENAAAAVAGDKDDDGAAASLAAAAPPLPHDRIGGGETEKEEAGQQQA
jgi:hypothetical protein